MMKVARLNCVPFFREEYISKSGDPCDQWKNKMINSLGTTGLMVLISVFLLCLLYAKFGFGLQSKLGLADIIDVANM